MSQSCNNCCYIKSLCFSLQDVGEKYSTNYPKLYIPGQKNILFNKKSFVFKLLHGLLTSLLLFFIPYGIFQKATSPDGIDYGDMEFFATTVACCLVVTVNLQVIALKNQHHFMQMNTKILIIDKTYSLEYNFIRRFGHNPSSVDEEANSACRFLNMEGSYSGFLLY